MVMKMTKSQKKIGKVMREFKKGELNIGQSKQKVKNPKQAIAIALSEAGKSRKQMAVGGLANATRTFTADSKAKEVNHSKFTDAQGYLVGGVDVEMSNPQETQVQEVQGQGSVLSEKRRSAKWY
jgi:N-acetylglucosamine kinase-like BadF-type ATPase